MFGGSCSGKVQSSSVSERIRKKNKDYHLNGGHFGNQINLKRQARKNKATHCIY